jgi:hypothetical protein
VVSPIGMPRWTSARIPHRVKQSRSNGSATNADSQINVGVSKLTIYTSCDTSGSPRPLGANAVRHAMAIIVGKALVACPGRLILLRDRQRGPAFALMIAAGHSHLRRIPSASSGWLQTSDRVTGLLEPGTMAKLPGKKPTRLDIAINSSAVSDP